MDDFLDSVEDAIQKGDYARWIVYAQNNLIMVKVLKEYEGEDIVKMVIVKTFEGVRSWKQEIPINIYMQNNIRSVIYALKTKKKRNGYESRLDEDRIESLESRNGEVITAGELHREMDAKEMLELVEDLLIGDDEALLVLEEWKLGKTNIEIGKELGLEAKEVSNIKRRIKYKAQTKAAIYHN